MRAAVLAGTLAVIVLLGVLTIGVIAEHGLDPLTFFSLLVLGLLGTGLFGALRDGGDDDDGPAL